MTNDFENCVSFTAPAFTIAQHYKEKIVNQGWEVTGIDIFTNNPHKQSLAKHGDYREYKYTAKKINQPSVLPDLKLFVTIGGDNSNFYQANILLEDVDNHASIISFECNSDDIYQAIASINEIIQALTSFSQIETEIVIDFHNSLKVKTTTSQGF